MRAFMLAMLATPALVAAQGVTFPLLLPDRAVEVAHPPAGWLGSSNGPARLTGGGLISGHPHEEGFWALLRSLLAADDNQGLAPSRYRTRP